MANPKAALQQMARGGTGYQAFGPMYNTPVNQQFQDAANVFLQSSGTGLQMPDADQINPYLFFGNSGFAQNHPTMARVLDNGLSGLAFTRPSNTPGEAMNSIAQGILASRQAHIGNISNQYMAPLAMAGQLQGLQAGQQALDLSKAQGEYYKGRAQYYANGGHAAAEKPEYVHYETRADGTYGVTIHGDVHKLEGIPGKFQGVLGNGKSRPERLASLEFIDQGRDPADEPGEFRKLVSKYVAEEAASTAGAGASARKSVDLANGGVSPADQLDYDVDKQGLIHSLLDPKDFMSTFTAKKAGFKSPQEYNDSLTNAFKQKHSSILGSGPIAKKAAKGAPKAVAPPTGSPAPAKNSIPKVTLNKDGSFTIG